MSKKGFTLVELLAVIVIIGLVSAIAIPTFNNLNKNNDEKKYKTYENLVKNATNLYMEGYSKSISKETSCFKIDYNTLKKEGLLEEENISCYGTITGNRIKGDDFKYAYYLTCENNKGKIIHSEEYDSSSGCLGVNKKYEVYTKLKYDNSSGTTYVGTNKDNWTTKGIYQEFSNNDAYSSGLKKYQISDNFGEWQDVIGNSITTTESINTYRCVRAVDNEGILSGEKCYYLAIDNETPNIKTDSELVVDYNSSNTLASEIKVDFGLSGGNVVCKVNNKTINKPSDMELGVNDASCTATGNNGLAQTKTITIRHKYIADYVCTGGRTLSGNNCTYYYSSNEGKCGCNSYNQNCSQGSECEKYSTCQHESCGVKTYSICQSSLCGVDKTRCSRWGEWTDHTCCLSTSQRTNTQLMYRDTDSTQYQFVERSGCPYQMFQQRDCKRYYYAKCRAENCPVEEYNTCESTGCACEKYKTVCVNTTCKVANSCTIVENQYRISSCTKKGNTNTTATLVENNSYCQF